MISRIPTNYFIPQGRKRVDFKDVIDELLETTKIKVEDGNIMMRLIHREKEVTRFGKKFNICLFAFFGNVHIYVTEI